jgi:uncharacterized protein YjbI with pentapeptide repeats
MDVDEPGEDRRGQPRQSAPAAVDRLSDGAVLAGETFFDEVFRLVSAARGHFTDCLFRGCVFEKCDFRRCDFEAVVFESCTFIDCDFSSADLRSVEFSQCKITDAQFPNGAIKACTFTTCEFTRARFYRQSFEENLLTDCLLESCRFHRATMLHIEFRRCTFRDSSIADCTSLYHVFEACSFSGSELNVDSVPLSFGLSRENLLSLRLVWQGKRIKQATDVEGLLEDLLSSVAGRGWSIPAAVLTLNFAMAPTRDAFDLAFAGIAEAVRARRPLRDDELKFFARIVSILSAHNEMPFLPVMKGLDLIVDLAEQGQQTHKEALRPLFHALREAEVAATQAWERTWRLLRPLHGQVVEVEFVFDQNLGVPLQPLMEELQHIVGGGGPAPKLLGTRTGSYIELLSIPVSTLVAITVSMGMLVRIIDHMILFRAKYEMLRGAKVPDAIYARALAPPPPASAELLRELRLLANGMRDGQAPLTTASADAIASQIREIRVLEESGAEPTAP